MDTLIMRQIIFALLMALPTTLQAQDWMPMSGEEIREALTGRALSYGSSWQDFRASGRTLYHAGADAWGYWRIQNDQYCSQWPPSDLWACYDMEHDGDRLRFVGAQGDVSVATYKD